MHSYIGTATSATTSAHWDLQLLGTSGLKIPGSLLVLTQNVAESWVALTLVLHAFRMDLQPHTDFHGVKSLYPGWNL